MYIELLGYILAALLLTISYLLYSRFAPEKLPRYRPLFVAAAFFLIFVSHAAYLVFIRKVTVSNIVFAMPRFLIDAAVLYAVYRSVLLIPAGVRNKFVFLFVVVGICLMVYGLRANVILYKSITHIPECSSEPMPMYSWVGETDMHRLLGIPLLPTQCRDLKTGQIQPY